MRSPSRPAPVILCVDDEPDALLLRKTILEQAGYNVFTALEAGVALKIFASQTIDLVVSDHLFPGVSGTEMAGAMKHAKPVVPILVLSGLPEPPEGTEHANRFLNKSEGPEKLLETVAELLRYRRRQICDGIFRAELVCDTLERPTLWHYVIQRTGSADVICWSQTPTEKAAISAARRELRLLNKKAVERG